MRGFEKEESLDTLPDKVVQKIIAVVELVETERIVPANSLRNLPTLSFMNAEYGGSRRRKR